MTADRNFKHGAADREQVMLPLLFFNEQIRAAAFLPLNEYELNRIIDDLEGMPYSHPEIYCLTLARITELALLCAGNYADGCEFQAAADLLINPQKISVYVRGVDGPVIMQRHTALSKQMAAFITDDNPVKWLSENTQTCVEKKAILPILSEWLAGAGLLSDTYLDSVKTRMEKVAQTICFLNTWKIQDVEELFHKMRQDGPAGASFIKKNLCRFDPDTFDAIGDDIISIAGGDKNSRFLRKGDVIWRDGKPFFAPFVMPDMI